MIKKQLLFCLLIFIFFFSAPLQAEAKKKRKIFQRRWSFSIVNAFGFKNFPNKKISAAKTYEWVAMDGPMNPFFSSLEISRNFGYHEIGARIQNTGPVFVSPFWKWNLNKNKGRASFVPSLTLGLAPSYIMGIWLRGGFGISLNSYVSLSPFMGVSAYLKIKEDVPDFEEYNIHLNMGLRINLYY